MTFMGGGEIVFREDIQAPASDLIIQFSGKNPFWVMTAALGLLRDTLKVSAVQLREDDIRWDVLGEKKTFYGIWRGRRTEDNWTTTWLQIIAQGGMDRERSGDVTIKLKGWLATKFSYSNELSRNFWLLWNYGFYWKQRRAYIDQDKDDMQIIKEKILRAYGIEQTA